MKRKSREFQQSGKGDAGRGVEVCRLFGTWDPMLRPSYTKYGPAAGVDREPARNAESRPTQS